MDAILGALRDAVTTRFTVKTRIGFDTPEVFDELLPIFAKHSLDLLTVHGRTVHEMYRSEVHYDFIARAAAALPCPVIANGNVHSPRKAEEVLRLTGARGLMIGRGAIRNPWLFTQIRQHQRGEPLFVPHGRDVLGYVQALYAAVCTPDVRESAQVQKMKKYMNFLALGVDPKKVDRAMKIIGTYDGETPTKKAEAFLVDYPEFKIQASGGVIPFIGGRAGSGGADTQAALKESIESSMGLKKSS